MKRLTSLLLACAAVAAYPRDLRGQGGPPMITDDPGTPGNEKWEINLAMAFEHRSGETLYDLPALDFNYGVGEHIQLTLQTAPALLTRNERGPVAGLGGTEAALKWRFLDEEQSGLDISMFPRVIFNVIGSSVRRGLAEDGTRFQIPFQAAKQFGAWRVDFEMGPLASSVGRAEWLYGIIVGLDVAKATVLMAELHGTARTNFTRDVLTVNCGLRHEFTKTHILILSLGHEIRSPDESLAVIGYFGMQFLY